MGCSTKCVKYLLLIFNLIFVVAGATLIGVGVVLLLKNNDIQNFIPDKYHLGLPPILMMVIGSVVFLTALFGCCGAIEGSECMLKTFTSILFTILVVQVAIACYAFLIIGDSNDLRSSVRQAVKKSFDNHNDTSVKKEIDTLQTFLQCCGIDGPEYWQVDPFPNSCCSSNKDCGIQSEDCYKRGCVETSYEWFKSGLDLLGILAVAVGSIAILGALFACCLTCSISNELRREAYA